MFLEQSITAEIIDTEQKANQLEDDQVITYTINKGSNDGVFKYMLFYGKDDCCKIKIIDIQKSSSLGQKDWCHGDKTACKKVKEISSSNK